MKKLAGLALVAACATVAAVPLASAADLWVPPVRGPIVEPVPVEMGSNWYLRGDIGYRMHDDPSATYSGVCGTCDYDDEQIDGSFMLGAGAGYKFNPWFRADVTIDYGFASEFGGTLYGMSETADISGWTALANAYVDLGSWNRITPYVGAGLGVAQTSIDNYAIDGTEGYYADSNGDWKFAWAVMAGVAYDMTPNLAVDVGYRYLSLGDTSTEDVYGFGDTVKLDDLHAHEARIGVRYMLD